MSVVPLYDPDEATDGRTPTVTVGKTAYMIDGEHYDRISAVLDIVAKPGLDKWKREKGFQEADRLLKEAAWLGTRVHALVEEFCRGRDPMEYGFPVSVPAPSTPGVLSTALTERWLDVRGTELEPYYHGYVAWHREHVKQTILLETTLWSRTHGFAGTFDHFAELTDLAVDEVNAELELQESPSRVPYGCLALLDNKTSKYLSWIYRLQTAAYKGAILERRLLPEVDLRGIVHLSSKTPGRCRLVPYPPATDARDWGVWLGVLDTYRMSLEYDDDWKR